MNCPGHILIYKQGIKSYRELPLRYGEFGNCHRNEPTGGLHGIMRVRGFTQDDGHIFAPKTRSRRGEGVHDPAQRYADFRLHRHHLQTVDAPGKAHRHRKAGPRQAALADGLRASGCELVELPGGVYGPKIEYTLKDALGRPWQCGTIRVDPKTGTTGCWSLWAKTVRATGPSCCTVPSSAVGAFHRHLDRTVRRSAANLAGTSAGGGAQYHRCAGRIRPKRGQKRCKIKGLGSIGSAQRENYV